MKRLWLYCFMAVAVPLFAGGGNDLDAASFVKLLPERFEAIGNYWMVDDYLFFTDKAAPGGAPSSVAPALYAFDLKNKKITPAPIPGSLKIVRIARIVKADFLSAAAKDSAESWFESFIDKIMESFKQEGGAQWPAQLLNADRQMLRRYLQIMRDGKEDALIELDDCLAQLAGLYPEYRNKERVLLDDFRKEWSIGPNEILFDDSKKPDFSAVPSALKKAEPLSGYYFGKSEDVAFWIECYNLIINEYKELKNAISRDYEELLQETFSVTLKCLGDLREDNQGKFDEAREQYNKRLGDIRAPFYADIRMRLLSVSASSIEMSDGVDYCFFSLDDARYAAICNNGAYDADEYIKIFYGKGFEIFRCGVIDTYIFFCVDNAVVLYDAFTLEEYTRTPGRSQALFAVYPDDSNDPVFIMKTNKGYGIKRLTRNKSSAPPAKRAPKGGVLNPKRAKPLNKNEYVFKEYEK
ncbi:MAG: hypothetical protein LBL45_12205 [Treponema sp.]|nr:hypothetical protein [Treponema sp.]